MKVREKKLTPRLKEILLFFCCDYDIPAIVKKTGLPYRTVESRVNRIRAILGKRHPQGMITVAHQKKHINLDEIKVG